MKRLAALALCLALVGCGGTATPNTPPPIAQQTPLFKVSVAINDIRTTNKLLAESVIQANTQKLMSDATTGALLNVSDKIGDASTQASAIVRGLASLPPGTKVDIWTTLEPISLAVTDSLSNGLVTINDANTKLTIQSFLTTIQAAIAVVRIQTRGGQ